MSSINGNFFTNNLNSTNFNKTNLQNELQEAKEELFNINTILSGDSFISTKKNKKFNTQAANQTHNNTDKIARSTWNTRKHKRRWIFKD